MHRILFIAATTTLEQQPTLASTAVIQKTSNGNSVLQRVISLTTANHSNENNSFTKPTKPTFIPEKLQFSAYEKYEGERLGFNECTFK